jgi:recombination protein RecA
MKIKISEIKGLLKSGKKVKVKSVNGEFVDVVNYFEKGMLPTFLIKLENGNEIKTSLEHRCFSKSGWVKTCDLIPNETSLLCENGEFSLVKSIVGLGQHKIVDIEVNHPEHAYFGNGILNHNSGKSYFAAQIAANAQKKGIKVIYFDSEASIDRDFWINSGVDLDEILYLQATSVEFVLETIETLLATDDQYLFILDSLAMTPTRKEEESSQDFNPLSSMAEKARILSKGVPKIITPLINKKGTFLVLNQLKTNIARTPAEQLTTPWTTPGGKTLNYAYSLRIWLTKRKAKDSFILDEHEYKIGSEVKAKLEKSRFGTEGRECTFKIIWGDQKNIGVQNAESIFQAIKGSPRLSGGAAGRWAVTDDKGNEVKFMTSEWNDLYKNDKKFKAIINSILEEEVIQKFETRSAKASTFYDVDGEGEKKTDEDFLE